jgi:hypothetical protein
MATATHKSVSWAPSGTERLNTFWTTLENSFSPDKMSAKSKKFIESELANLSSGDAILVKMESKFELPKNFGSFFRLAMDKSGLNSVIMTEKMELDNKVVTTEILLRMEHSFTKKYFTYYSCENSVVQHDLTMDGFSWISYDGMVKMKLSYCEFCDDYCRIFEYKNRLYGYNMKKDKPGSVESTFTEMFLKISTPRKVIIHHPTQT